MGNASMRMSMEIVVFCVLTSFATPVFAQEEDMDPVPLPILIPFEDIDLNGTWNFNTNQPTVTGGCPAGNAMSGTAAITQQGTEVTFKYTSGVRCRPAAVCSYTGTLSEENAKNELIVSNTVNVDEEGGTVSSTMVLTIFDNELARGTGMNNYDHPEGFACQWLMHLELTRELEKEEKREE